MKVEVTIDRNKKLPFGAISALEAELHKRLSQRFDYCSLVIHQAGSDSLSVTGVEKDDQKIIEKSYRKLGKALTIGLKTSKKLRG